MEDIKISPDTLILSEYEKHLLKIFKFHYLTGDSNISWNIEKAVMLLHKRHFWIENGTEFKRILPSIIENCNKLLFKICNSKLYEGRIYLDCINHINNEVFFNRWYDAKKEFTKDEIAYEYLRKIISELQTTQVIVEKDKQKQFVYDLLQTDELIEDIVKGLEKYNKKSNRFKVYKKRYKKYLELDKKIKNSLEFKEYTVTVNDLKLLCDTKCNVAVYNIYRHNEKIVSFDYEILKFNGTDRIYLDKNNIVLKIKSKSYISDYYHFSRLLYLDDMKAEFNKREIEKDNNENSEMMYDFIQRYNIIQDMEDNKIDFCIELKK